MTTTKKTLLITIIFFGMISYSSALYKLETGSERLVEKYDISTINLDKEIFRKEFVEILYKWYSDYKKVPHIVATYSFDEDGVWVSLKQLQKRRVLVSWNELFNNYGGVALNRIFKYYYEPKYTWTEEELEYERNNNILVGEY